MSAVIRLDMAGARRLTERIRLVAVTVSENIDKLKSLVTEAKESGAHSALGYASWPAYLADVLGETPLRLEREMRQELVAELSAQGMSTRAIAPIVSVDRKTIERDVRGGTNVPPAEPVPHVDEITGEIIEPAASRTVTGLDGKTYTKPAPKPQAESSPSSELSLVNDIRLYLNALGSSSEIARLSPAAKQHIITALKNTITQIDGNES